MNTKTLNAMIMACKNGNHGTVKKLLKDMKVKDVNYSDDENETFLMIAARGGWINIVKILVGKGAKVNMRNNDGLTALQMSARKGYKKVVEHLMKNGGHADAEDNEGNNVLHNTVKNVELVDKNMLEYLIEAWIEKDLDLDNANNVGDTPLHMASAIGNIDAVQKLLEKGANGNIRNERNETAFHKAAPQHTNVLELLLEHKKEFQEDVVDGDDSYYDGDINGDTPAHVAAKAGNYEALQLLINNGIDLLSRNNSGKNMNYD